MPSLLLGANPIRGHVDPMLAVARHLIDRGHRVRFMTGGKFAERVSATGATFVPLPPAADFYDDSDLDGSFPGRAGLSGAAGLRFDVLNVFLRPSAAQLAGIDAAQAAEPFDALVIESGFGGGGLYALRPGGAPVVGVGIFPLGVGSADTAPFGLGLHPMGGPVGHVRNRLLSLLTERIVFRSAQEEFVRIVEAATGRSTSVFFFDSACVVDAFVQLSVPSFEYPRSDLPSTVHFIGPIMGRVASNLPLPEWWGDLDGAQAVVHVTQGTAANSDWTRLIGPTLEGLAGEDLLVVVSAGGREVDSLPPLPRNARAASLLPYDKLFPLVDVFVTNGGYGGIHHALEHAVPIVVAGQTEEKKEVSARVSWSGAGIDLKTDSPSSTAVAAAVRNVLSKTGYRERATAISREVVSSPGVAGLEAVIDNLLQTTTPRR